MRAGRRLRVVFEHLAQILELAIVVLNLKLQIVDLLQLLLHQIYSGQNQSIMRTSSCRLAAAWRDEITARRPICARAIGAL